jgi:hypothetical protein
MKLREPCSLCKGQLPVACIICGWKKKDIKLTPLEEAKLEGAKARHKFLSRVASGMQKFGMETTGSEQVDRAVREEVTQLDIDMIREEEPTRKDIRD